MKLNMCSTLVLAAGAMIALLSSVPASADPAADRCAAGKLKATGRYGQALLACNAKAVAHGASVDPECTSAAAIRLEEAFQRAEDAGGCVTTSDAPSIEGDASSDVDSVVSALAPDPTDEARACAASKMKAAGKHGASILGCYAKGAKNSEAPDGACIVKADAKIISAFAKAEDRGGCTTTGDTGTIEGLDDASSTSRVRSLSPVCGDGIQGPTQQCEPSDDAACPGQCSAACICVIPPDCGNGVAEFPEECDDGNDVSGDGCSSACLLESTDALCDGVASHAGTAIDAVLVTDTLSEPIYATAPRLDPARLFVVERAGTIRILDLATDTIRATPFLDIHTLTTTDGERGLLSMAFDPDYETNRRFYVYYTNHGGDITIARYQASAGNPDIADTSTAAILLVIEHSSQSNHNGGQLAFGPDGYLYAGTGDGGGGGDPYENGQNDSVLLGKMLRIDTNVAGAPYYAVPPTNPHYAGGTDPLELIWAKGVRNPWRFSFDRATGALVIADVGQNTTEEIDYQGASSAGGENYGWDIFEGTMCFEPDPDPVCPSPPTGFTFPVFEYTHDPGCAITGGFVYRGCALPDLRGTYFYSDYCGAFLKTLDLTGGTASDSQDRTADAESAGASISGVISFGQDARGELYVLEDGGALYRIVGE